MRESCIQRCRKVLINFEPVGRLLTHLGMLASIRNPDVSREQLTGEFAVILDSSSITEHCAERVLESAWKSSQECAKSPLGMARSAPWDYLRPDVSVSHSDFLHGLLVKPYSEDSGVNSAFVGEPPEKKEFIERHLPGVVEGHPWDGHPTNAISWDVHWPEGVDEPIPFVELARAHVSDDPTQNAQMQMEDSDAEEYLPREYQPVTTKAGGRLWSISFAAPNSQAAEVSGLRAAYPFQLLVRFDSGRQALIYDAFEYVPAMQVSEDTKAEHLVSPDELRGIEGILKRHRRQLARLVGEQLDLQQLPASHAERCRQHGAKKLRQLLEWVRFKTSKVRRVRFPVSAVCGARLVVLESAHSSRPNGNLPPARGSLPLSSLGQRSADSHKGWRALPGTAAAGGPELESLAVLVLELSQLGTHSKADFAEMPVWATHRNKWLRKPCQDWTPDGIFSRARRHYIVGDASEMTELSKALATASPHLARFLRMPPPDDDGPVLEPACKLPAHINECVRRMKNSLGADVPQLLPSRTSAVPSLASLAVRKLLAAEVEPPATSGRRQLPFKSEKDVHDFLRRAGVKKPQEVNLCLKAGMLNGHIPIPAKLLMAKDTRPFLKQVLLQAKCYCCGRKSLKCTVRQALHQSCVGYDYGDGGEGAAVQCKECAGNYITGLCTGNARFESGKFHNHCEECPDFGICIGDYREAHCDRCGDHFFAGNSGFPCPCTGKDSDDFDAYSEGGSSMSRDESDEASCHDTASPSLPTTKCWSGYLHGISIPALHKELLQKAYKLKPALATDHGLTSLPLAELLALVHQLHPRQPNEMDFPARNGDEGEEESNGENDPFFDDYS